MTEVVGKAEWNRPRLPVLIKEGKINISGGDALRGHTRSHPEHDG